MISNLTERLAVPPALARLSLGLDRAIDTTLRPPRLHESVELAAFTTRWGERYAIAHDPRTHRYLRLTGKEGDLARNMDGTRTVGALVIEGLTSGTGLDFQSVSDLVGVLRGEGFLDKPPIDVYAAALERTMPGHMRTLDRVWQWLRKQTIVVPGVDRFVGVVYRWGGRIAFTAPANIAALVVLVAGLVAFIGSARSGRYSGVRGASADTAAWLFGLMLAALFVHEMGHALAVRRAGRRIVGAGFQLYLGHPAFFIDSTDLLLASPRARAINALAGPYAEAVLAGIVALLVWFRPDAGLAPLLFAFTGLLYLSVLLNLIPFIELDGYWLLSDVLDVPRLRQRSFAVLRYELPDRLRGRREPFSRAERGLAAFGIAGITFTAAALVTALTFWGPILRQLIAGLWRTGASGKLLLGLLAILVGGPLAHGLIGILRATATRIRVWLSDLAFFAQTSWRVEAADAVVRLPFVGDLDDEALADIAGRVGRHRVREGETVVRQGEAADAFYVVRRGRFAIVERDAQGKERFLRRATAGGSFGELALIEKSPRTATVRAETDGELFVVDAGTFSRLIAPTTMTPELVPAVRPLVEVWSLPPYRHLSQEEAGMLAERGAWLDRGPSEIVIAEGDAPDGFYVLASGQAEVLSNGVRTATLKAGDHFGEVALLRDVPRTATVRTLTHVRLHRIDAETFRTLVSAAFARGRLSVAGGYMTSMEH